MEKSNTFALLNTKVFPSRALFQTWFKRPLHTKPSAHRQPKQHTSPDGGIGRRAGLKHQWSNPCRFDPGSGYEKDSRKSWVLFSCTNKAQVPCSLLNPCQLTLTSPVRGIPTIRSRSGRVPPFRLKSYTLGELSSGRRAGRWHLKH